LEPLHTPRIVGLLATVGLLVWVNRTAPRIVPAVLGILVLYAALANIDRVTALIGSFQGSLDRLYRPRIRAAV
jgi:hypothetical protein